MVDIKKALAFIKANAVETPMNTRSGQEFVIPEQIVNVLKEQINKNNGSFAIDKESFNEQFGWKPKNSKALYLQRKLNKQYSLDGEVEWHVGTIAKGTLYKFEIRAIKIKTEE